MWVRTLRRLSATVLIVLFAAPAAQAEWETRYEKGKTLLKAKKYRPAENELIEALTDSEAFGPTDPRRIKTLRTLAELYRKTRQWAAASPLLEEVMKGYRDEGTEQSPEAGSVLNRLGILYHQQKLYDKAEEAYEASLAIKKRRYRQNITSIAVVETNLAELYRKRGDVKKAEELLVKAVRDKERELGPKHPTLVASLVDLGLVFNNTDRYDEAIPLFERAMKIAEASTDKQKDEHLGMALHNLADAHQAKGDLDAARRDYKKALRLREKALGAEHPYVATTCNNLGNTLVKLKQYEDAVTHYERALKIREKEYGGSSTQVARTLGNYAYALEQLGLKAAAQKARDRMAAINSGGGGGGGD